MTMANPSDRDLGMDRPIIRRDFLNGVGLALTGSLTYPGCGKFSWRDPLRLVKIGKGHSFREHLAMEPTPKLSRDEFIAQMRAKIEEPLGRVADAINEAPPGHIISGSEEQVRDLFADLRQQAFEKGLQMRLDAAEAAFPPSEGPQHREGQA